MKLVIRAAVRADLSNIAAYISRDNPDRANTFAQELSVRIRTIGDRPMSFPLREDGGPGLRAALHANYFIIFRVERDRVSVLRVLHAARNIANLI